MTLLNIIPLSNNKHLRLVLSRKGTTLSAMLFGTSTNEFPYEKGAVLDIAATLDLNEYNGSTSVSVIIKDVKAHDDNPQALLESKRDFEDFCRGTVTDRRRLRNLLPTREDFALLYRFLRDSNGYAHSADTLPGKLHYRLSYGKIRVMLEAMSETGLVEIREGLKTNRITLRPVSGKVNLENAQILKKLREVIA